MMEERSALPELPQSWVWTTLAEIAQIILGQSPPSSTYNEDEVGLPFYQGKAEFGDIYPTPRKWCSQPKKIAEKGDVLISVRAPVGPTNICQEKSCIGRGLAAIRGLDGIQPRFILYLMRSSENVIAGRGTGTTFKAITGSQLRGFEISLPPLPEQHRIVAKIEELFTQLDVGVAALEKAKAQLQRYRQAVLKAAVEGELTKEWREAHRGELEPASVLLERILEERRARWEAEQLEKMRAKGKMPRDDKWKKKYKEPPLLDRTDLPELPEGWMWIPMSLVGANEDHAIVDGPFGSNLKIADYVEDREVPVITITNIDVGFHPDELRYVTKEKFETIKRSAVRPGDIIMAKIGASYGKSGFYPDWMQVGIIPANMLKITVSRNMDKLSVFHYLNSNWFKRQLDGIVKSTAQPAFNVSAFRLLPFPLSPLLEQHQIVEEIEHRLSVADEMEKAVEQSLKRAERLRQSILKRAFEGKLVPQDPSDEPASVLLERIKAEKAQREGKGKGGKRSRRQKRPRQLELFTS